MAFSKARARKHIERLEKRHDVEVRIVKEKWDSEAQAVTRQVWIPDPTTPLKYLIALHEFGHVLDKVSAKVMRSSVPECEAAAWRWAVDHAEKGMLTSMSPADWQKVGLAWLTSVSKSSPFPR